MKPKWLLLALLLCFSGANAKPLTPSNAMNLTELANHICEQCGMKDTDDVSAAKMFLQRRLEMIWHTQLWRSALVEATMTLSPDGTCTLANTTWIPERGTLLLPPEIDKVLAVRTSQHTLNVASLESYFRQDNNKLELSGDPMEFQVLRPALVELANPNAFQLHCADAADATLAFGITYSSDGVALTKAEVNPSVGGTVIGYAQLVARLSHPATAGAVTFQYYSADNYEVGVNDTGLAIGSLVRLPSNGLYYELIAKTREDAFTVTSLDGFSGTEGKYERVTANETGPYLRYYSGPNGNVFSLELDISGYAWTIYAGGEYWYVENVPFSEFPPNDTYQGNAGGNGLVIGSVASTNGTYAAPPLAANWQLATPNHSLTLSTDAGSEPLRQRIRLTSLPEGDVSLRVLGKLACPVLDDYDAIPISNAEPCLMAFARGDLLLRQRQHGKAQLAQSEGMALLKQLADAEAHQQASRHQIIPDNGYGDGSYHLQPHF